MIIECKSPTSHVSLEFLLRTLSLALSCSFFTSTVSQLALSLFLLKFFLRATKEPQLDINLIAAHIHDCQLTFSSIKCKATDTLESLLTCSFLLIT